jgi:hypothetical protein
MIQQLKKNSLKLMKYKSKKLFTPAFGVHPSLQTLPPMLQLT